MRRPRPAPITPAQGEIRRPALPHQALLLPLILLLLPVGAGGQQTAPPPTGAITGQVRAEGRGPGHPLPYAVVEWRGEGIRSLLADSLGHYRIEGLPAGRGRLRAHLLGYEMLEVELSIPPGGGIRVDLELRSAPLPLEGVHVRVHPERGTVARPDSSGLSRPGMGMTEASLRAAEAVSGLAEAGVGHAAGQVGPGQGGDPSDPRSTLFMRGSVAEMKLVLLDGAPVYAPFHVGGLIQGFDPGTLGGAELLVGGAPARFDGGLSYILDLRTRAPAREGWRSAGSLDLLSARARVEGPLGSRGGILLAGRGLHHGQETLLEMGRSPYGYGEGLTRIEVEPARGHTLQGTGFWNRETVRLDLPVAPSRGFESIPEDAGWGNRVGALRWRMEGEEQFTEVEGSVSGYRAHLPLRTQSPVLAEGMTRRDRVGARHQRALGGGSVAWGVSLDRMRFDFRAERFTGEADSLRYQEEGEARVVGGFLEADRPLSDEFQLRGGLRVDHFSGERGFRLAPRVALTWLLAPEVTLAVAGGRYHQHGREAGVARTLEDAPNLPGGGMTGGVATPPLPVLSASHLVVSLQNQLTPAVRLGLDGYTKWFSAPGGGVDEGLRSSGVDLRILRAGEAVEGWLGYSLSWFWNQSGGEVVAGTATQETDFTGRHLLSAGVSGRLGSRGGGELRIAFGDGLPLTGIPLASEAATDAPPPRFTHSVANLSGGSDPSLANALDVPNDRFLRIDAELHGMVTPSLGGRRLELRPYLRVLNALDRRDALFYYFEPWREEGVRPLAGLSVLPVFGVEWRF